MTQHPTRESLALQFARQWSKLPPEHFKVAVRVIESQIARENSEWEMKERNTHRLEMLGLVAGFVIALISLSGTIYFGARSDPAMAGICSGPSALAMLKIFVLRRDPNSKAIRPQAPQQLPNQNNPTL